MKPVKHLSAYGKKLANVPEISYKKGLFNSPLSHKPKEKHSVKVVRDKLEPMILRSPPTGESVVRFALPIPSSKTKELIAEDELLRKITKHLKTVADSLEETYGISTENVDKPVAKPAQEELSLSVGDDLNSFLDCCSQFAAQLEEAVQEERHILESLFQWFQQQVHQVEEISKDQNFSEVEFPAPDKTVTLSIAQVGKHTQKLEELKNRLREGSVFSWKALMSSSSRESRELPEAMEGCKNVQQKIEEFIKAHRTEEFIDVVAPEPQTAYSVSNQLTAMLKIFEKQSNMLQRVRSDQVLLETKYKQMQNDYEVLSKEKLMLEHELQKLKNTEKTKSTRDQAKKTMKLEKKHAKEKSEDSEEKKSAVKEFKIKEDFLKTQKKPTYDRTKKTMTTAKKHAKEKSEDSEEKKPLVKEFKIKEDFLKAQEAETAKLQLTQFLKEGELLKRGEVIHTTMEKSISKMEVEGGDLKYISLEKETSKAEVAGSSGQDTVGKIQEYPQEAETAKLQLTQFLKEGELLKRGEMIHITVERSISKLDVKGEDLEYIPLEKETSKAQVADSSGQDTNGKIQEYPQISVIDNGSPIEIRSEKKRASPAISDLSQILKSQDESAFIESSKEVSADEDQSPMPPSKSPDKSLSNKEIQDLLSVGTLLQGNETVATSFISPPDVTERKSMDSDTSKGDILEEILQSKTENQSYQEEREFQAHDKVPHENLTLENEMLSVLSMGTLEQKPFRMRRRNAIFISQQDVMISDENQLPEDMDLYLRSQSQTKDLEATINETFNTHDGVPDENLMLMHEESMSEKEMQVEKQMTSQDEGLITHDTVPDENLMLEHQEPLSTPQIQVKKQGTPTRKRFTTQDEAPHEHHMLEHQGSLSKSEIQMNQRTYKGEGLNGHFGVPDKNLVLVNQDSVSKPQMQVEKQVNYRGERRHSYFGAPDESLVSVSQESVSNATEETNNFQMQVKKQITFRRDRQKDQDMSKYSDGSFTLGDLELTTQRLTVENEADSELPHTAENLPALNPSINDLIFQLDLNKVVETDIEHLKGAVKRRMLMAEMKTESKSLLEADTEQLLDVTERGAIKGGIKTQSKSHLGTNVERLSDATGSGMTRGQLKKQSMNPPEADIERLLDVPGRDAIKEGIRTQSKSHPGTNVERLSDATGSGMTRGQLKKQSVNLPEADTEQLLDATGRSFMKLGIKTKSKSHPGTNVERLSDATGGGMTRGQLKKQSTYLTEADTERRLDVPGRHALKGGIRTQSKSHPGTNVERLSDATGGGMTRGQLKKQSTYLTEADTERRLDVPGRHALKGGIRTQSKSHPGTNVERLSDATGGGMTRGQLKKQSTYLTEADTERRLDVPGRHALKGGIRTQSKSHPGTNVERLSDATGSGMTWGQLKKQSVNLPEADTEQLLDATGRGFMKLGFRTQSKSHPGTNVERLSDATGGGMTRGQLKKQSTYLTEADTERRLDVPGRDALKGGIRTQSKSHPAKYKTVSGTNVERLSDATGSGMTRGQLKKQSVNLPEADTEQLLDATGRGFMKLGFRTQSKSHPGTNVERLSDATGGGMTRGQLKKQSTYLTEADTERRLDVPGRDALKGGIRTQSKSHPAKYKTASGTSVKRLSDATGRGMTRGQPKKQSIYLTEADTEQLLDATGRGFMKLGIRTQSKSHPETDIEHFTDSVGRENIIDEIKTQLKGYPGVNLFKFKGMPTQYQDFFTTPIEPSKASTNVNNFSPFGNQGMTLFENENRSSLQDFFPKRVTPRTFPTKVINLSPFGIQGGTDKNFSSNVTKPPKAPHGTFMSSSYKSTYLPSPKKGTSGYPKKIKQK